MIQSDFHMPQGSKWIYGKVLKYTLYTAILFMGQAFWKENIEDRVKLFESIINWNCSVKVTMADLHKIGLKMREWRFRELSF